MIKAGCAEKDVIKKFVDQLKQKDQLLAEKNEKLEEVARQTGMNVNDTEALKVELNTLARATGMSRTRLDKSPLSMRSPVLDQQRQSLMASIKSLKALTPNGEPDMQALEEANKEVDRLTQ